MYILYVGGGIEKGGMTSQSPSVRNEYGNLCFLLTPFSTPPFCLGDICRGVIQRKVLSGLS